MPFIQKSRTRINNKDYFKFSLVIPRNILEFMDWKGGDELEFKLQKGKVVLRRKI